VLAAMRTALSDHSAMHPTQGRNRGTLFLGHKIRETWFFGEIHHNQQRHPRLP
jgi:hypothetical protein